MRTFVSIMFVLLCLLSASAMPVNAQEGEYPPIAAYGIDGYLWLYMPSQEPERLTDRVSVWPPHDLAWSPDGRLLAFEATDGTLSILDIVDGSHMSSVGYPLDIIPFAFSEDSKHILFGVEGGRFGPEGPEYLDITEVEVNTGIETGGICCIERPGGYGFSDIFVPPPTRVLEEEIGWHFGVGSRFLEDTRFGILHSAPAEGGLQLNGEPIWPAKYAVLSSDRSKFASRNVQVDGDRVRLDDGIAIIDLATGEHTVLETDVEPSLLGWGGEGTLFYTSEESIGDLYSSLTDDQKQRLENQVGDVASDSPPPYLSHNQVFIHQLNLSDGSERIIYQTEAFAVGRLMPTPDGMEVFFTTIPNLDEWLDNLVNTEISCNTYECIRPLFPPSLYRLDVATGEVDLIGVGLYRATINFPAYERMMSNEAQQNP